MKTHPVPVVLAVPALVASGISAEPRLPPVDVRAGWSHPAVKDFQDWRILRYQGWGEAADGGSKVFAFEGAADLKFGVAAVSPQYWTEAEKRARAQVFYLIHEGRFYRVEAESEQEQALIAMLRAARTRLKGTGEIRGT